MENFLASTQQVLSLAHFQLQKAVDALFINLRNTQAAKKPNLLGNEEFFYLVVGLKKIPEKSPVNPTLLPLTHSFYEEAREKGAVEICVFTKDPQKSYKEKLLKRKSIGKVIGMTKLKAKYKPFEAKRLLASSFDFFVADDRIIHLLPPLLGKAFYDRKKIPIAINLKRFVDGDADLKAFDAEIEKIMNSTVMIHSKGPCVSIKIGISSQSTSDIVDNIKCVVSALNDKIAGGFENVQSLNLKTTTSIALPVYNTIESK